MRKPVSKEQIEEVMYSPSRALLRAAARQYGLLQHGGNGSDADYLMKRLAWKETRDLSSRFARTEIARAAKENDFQFFRRMGKALSKKPLSHSDMSERIGKLQLFLINHWVERRDGLPELCLLNREGLCAVCQNRLGRPQLTEAAVERERQRMGLRTHPHKIQAMEINGQLVFRCCKKGRKLTF